MDLNAIINEFCNTGASFEHRAGNNERTPGLSLSSFQPDMGSPLSLPTLPNVQVAGFPSLSDTAGGLSTHGLDFEGGLAGKTSVSSVTQLDSFLEDFQVRQKYAQLEEKYQMMESAAKAEISELRARLVEAHEELAEVGAARAVSGFTEKIVARQACEEEMHLSQVNLLAVRAEVTHHFERKLGRAMRFGPPEQLMQRLLSSRLHWFQLHYLQIWRAVVTLRPEPQNLRELEVEIRCWDKARRLRRLAFGARKIFSAWRVYADEQGRGRLRRLIDMAHDSCNACHTTVHRTIDKRFSAETSAVASRCFLEWLRRYQRSRQVARFWRFLGRERTSMRRCFVSFLRAVSASRQDKIKLLEGMGMVAPTSATWNDRIHMLETAMASVAMVS